MYSELRERRSRVAGKMQNATAEEMAEIAESQFIVK